MSDQSPEIETPEEAIHVLEVETELVVRDMAKRELDARIAPWDKYIVAREGPEMVKRGAFAGTDPRSVVLMLEHEGPPAGIGTALHEREDGAYMTFKVSSTPRGDEILTLANDGVTRHVSVGFVAVPGGTETAYVNGRRTSVHHRVGLREVSTTWRPAYEEAAILQVREETEQVSETEEVTLTAEPDVRVIEALERWETRSSAVQEKVLDRLEKLEERSRMDITIPNGRNVEKSLPKAGEWFQAALRILSGERVSDLQMRDLADIITTDNIGVVPPNYSTEMIGVIDPRRPFMNTTRQLATPDSGMTLILPRIKQRPAVDIQDDEKDELESQPTVIDTVSFDAVTKGGAGDISLQLLKRSSPSFLTLYLQLLAEAYAQDSEHEAVESMVDLIGDYGGVGSGGTLDPENLMLGAAWGQGFSAMRRAPDTIWLSSSAVAAFIDAKASTTNAPLYSQLQANFTAGGGVGGSISGLRAVHVPALDDQGVDVLIGPSQGFAWAEDGTYTLQVDVPAKAGRDVALVGILWFAPIYPSAFTAYTIGS